jgi:hypothetical protein
MWAYLDPHSAQGCSNETCDNHPYPPTLFPELYQRWGTTAAGMQRQAKPPDAKQKFRRKSSPAR